MTLDDFNKLLDDFVVKFRETHPYKDDPDAQLNILIEETAANVCVNLLYRYHELLKKND